MSAIYFYSLRKKIINEDYYYIESLKIDEKVYIDDEVWAVGANDDEKWDFPSIFKKLSKKKDL